MALSVVGGVEKRQGPAQVSALAVSWRWRGTHATFQTQRRTSHVWSDDIPLHPAIPPPERPAPRVFVCYVGRLDRQESVYYWHTTGLQAPRFGSGFSAWQAHPRWAGHLLATCLERGAARHCAIPRTGLGECANYLNGCSCSCPGVLFLRALICDHGLFPQLCQILS